MAWFTPFLLPAIIGAGTSLAQGRNPLVGAGIGAATGGLLQGFDFGSALDTIGKSAASNVATNAPTLGGLNLAGAGISSAATPITTGAIGSFTPSILTTEGAKGVAPNIFDKAMQGLYNMGLSTDGIGSDAFNSTLMAQSLLDRNQQQPPPVETEGVTRGRPDISSGKLLTTAETIPLGKEDPVEVLDLTLGPQSSLDRKYRRYGGLSLLT
jgi:hypothetical protein